MHGFFLSCGEGIDPCAAHGAILRSSFGVPDQQTSRGHCQHDAFGEATSTVSGTCSTLEAAQRLGVSIQTVQRWVDLGQLRAWKTVGGHRRIETASVDALLRDRQVSLARVTDEAGRNTRYRTVLVVDDDPGDRDLMTLLVAASLPNATVATASNGFEALLAIGQATPDVLITDVMMPHMNGFEMLNHLDTATHVRPRFILATSSYSVQELSAFGRLPEGVEFLGKPIDGQALTRLLDDAPSPRGTDTEPAAAGSRERD